MFVYLMTDKNHKHLHAGFTPDIRKCLEFYGSLPEKENFHKMVYMEEVTTEKFAKHRVVEITYFNREQKENLIQSANPDWIDLTAEILWIF